MSKSLKKLILRIHLWIGLVTGVVIVVEGVTGAIYIFSLDISELAYKDRYHISGEPADEPRPISQLQQIAKNAIGEDIPLLRVFTLNDPKATIAFTFQKLNPEAVFYNSYMDSYKTVFINPYTAEIVKVENTKWEFFNIVLWLHLTLLLNHGIGGHIVSWSVLAFLIMIVSGLVLWWPKKKKNRKQRFWLAWKPGFGLKRKTFDLHAVLGFYVTSLALIIALTGLFYSFPFIRDSMKWIANGGKTIERPFPETLFETDSTETRSPIDLAFQQTIKKSPQANSYVIKMPRKPEYPYVIRAYMSHDVFYDREVHYFDSMTGNLIQSDTMSDLTSGEKYSNMNYDIHVGGIGGLPTKILAFFACLIIASLPVTGFLIWRNKSYTL